MIHASMSSGTDRGPERLSELVLLASGSRPTPPSLPHFVIFLLIRVFVVWIGIGGVDRFDMRVLLHPEQVASPVTSEPSRGVPRPKSGFVLPKA